MRLIGVGNTNDTQNVYGRDFLWNVLTWHYYWIATGYVETYYIHLCTVVQLFVILLEVQLKGD